MSEDFQSRNQIPRMQGVGQKKIPAPTTPSPKGRLSYLGPVYPRLRPHPPQISLTQKATFHFCPHPSFAHHVDDHLAQALPLALAEVLEDVTVVFLQQLEAHGQVVILQHRLCRCT